MIIAAVVGSIIGLCIGALILFAIYTVLDIRDRRRWLRESQASMDHFNEVVARNRAIIEALPYLVMEAQGRD